MLVLDEEALVLVLDEEALVLVLDHNTLDYRNHLISIVKLNYLSSRKLTN